MIPAKYTSGFFWAGCPEPSWLRRYATPMMVSHPRLKERCPVVVPPGLGPIVVDSGAYQQVCANRGWAPGAHDDYVAALHRYSCEFQDLVWASCQDMMCEEHVLALTGGTILDHQHATSRSVIALRRDVPDVHIIPILQGWTVADYHRHIEIYRNEYGLELRAEPLVGIGSVCSRKGTRAVMGIASMLAAEAIIGHWFGLALEAVERIGGMTSFGSSDSQSGLKTATFVDGPMPGTPPHEHPRGALRCSYCPVWLLETWAPRIERRIHSSRQLTIFDRSLAQ